MKKCILKSIVWLWLLCIISIGNAGTILAENGRTLYQVRGKTAKMLPEEKAAIGDLCHYLKLISGADFAAGSHKKYQIIIGEPAPSDKRTLKKHERRIVSENNDIYIWGEGRYGNVNAVYDFLKDIMRCRWFTVSGDEMIPRQQRIELDDLDYSIIPTVPKVTINQFSLTGVPALVRFARRHGLHTRADGFIGPTGHAIRSLLPCGQIPYGKREGNLAGPYATLKHKAYFKTNPEFFSMNEKGKRVRGRHYCFSNPELRKEFVKNISKVLTDAGYDGSPADFSIGHDDRSGKFCYCQACLALEKQYDHCAGAYFDFVFYVADRIGKKYPNIMLNILAYRKEQTLIPPSSEKIKSFPMNVTVCYAPLSADFSKPYTHLSNRKIADLFMAWGKVAHNIRWSAYPTTYPRPTFNFPLTANIRRGAENINFACANGIVSAYLEFGAGPADAFGFNDLRLYIYSEKLRDINADENVLIREFTDACYGQAAPALRKYLADLEEKELATKKFMRWNPQVLYVDYASAENLLKWTDDFKQMEKSVSAPRHLLNLRRARFTLDQTIIARWPYFTEAEKQKFGDLEKIITRCEKTIFDHNTDIASSFRQSAQRDKYIRLRNSKYLGGLDQLTGVARGGKPLPEFMQKKKALYRILPNRNKQALTPDPQAAFGLANFAKYPENNRSIFTLHYYRHGSTHRPDIQKVVNRKRIEKHAKDNNYHWYHLGAVPLSADAVLMFDGVSDQSNFPLGHLYAAENPGQLYDLYVSCAADKAKGILRIDQLVVIPLHPGKSSRANAACPVHRVPAEHLEKVLLAQVGRLFRTPAVLARICNEDFAGVLTAQQTEQALSSINTVWSQMFPLEQHKLIHTLISKVVVFEDKIQIHFEAAGLVGLLKEAGADFEIADGNQMLECVITVPCLLRRSSGKLEIQVESEDVPEQPVTPLKTAILQAHQGMAQLTSGKASTMQEIANKLKMDRSYLARTLKLANLAPDIVKLIWENRQPETLILDKLRKGIPEVGTNSGSCSFREDSGSQKSKMGSIEFCKLNFEFEGDLSGGQVPLKICKSYRKRRF